MKKRIFTCVLIMIMLMSPLFVVSADSAVAEITYKGTTTTYNSASALQNRMIQLGEQTFDVKLLKDIKIDSMLTIYNNSTVTLDLNGCSINRGKVTTSYDTYSNGEVIFVGQNAKLTIIDSNPEREHKGRLDKPSDSDYSRFVCWFENGTSGQEYVIKGGVITGGASDNGGGGMSIKEGAVVTMKGGTIAGNISYDGGGGVQLRDKNAKFTLDGGSIIYNGAWRQQGGGIKSCKDGDIVELISGNVSYNWAHAGWTTAGDGGGIYINSETDRALYIHGKNTSTNGNESRSVNISFNYAEDEGGGIYLDEGESTIINAAIEHNVANDGDGGGIIINDDGKSTALTAVTGCYINGNVAQDSDGDGGGIAVTDENYVQIANCVITYNQAGDEGGGIYFNAYGDGCNITGLTVTGNKARRNGGGIHLYDTVAIGGKMIVKDNTASDGRNNLYQYAYFGNDKLTLNDLSADSELYFHSDFDNGDIISKNKSKSSPFRFT